MPKNLSVDDSDNQIARVIQSVEESVSDNSSITSIDSVEHYQFEIKVSSTRNNIITNNTSADKKVIADVKLLPVIKQRLFINNMEK